MTPLLAALVTEARALAKVLGQAPVAKNTGENKPLGKSRENHSTKAAGSRRRR